MKRPYTYLALGDSYTTGEMVPATENFPNQVAAMLRQQGIAAEDPRIIAKTGWTTDELDAGIQSADSTEPLLPQYDMVTLLIGVNNQYRGRSAENYRLEFISLLTKALRFADNKNKRTAVISIPDWGVTPFAKGHDRIQIGRDIDSFNLINREESLRRNIHYIYITEWTREAAIDPALLAADGLHPSGKEYKRWAETIAATFRAEFTL
jgi:lysophospholipase L1-like esterase